MLDNNTWEDLFQYGLDALDHYGADAQLLKAAEELGELQDTIFKAVTGRLDKDHVTEELADVLIMLMQVKTILKIPGFEIAEWARRKIERSRNRMQGD